MGAELEQQPEEITLEQREGFLAFVRDNPGCGVRAAAESVGRKRWEFRALLAEDEFEAAYLEARGRAPDAIREEIRRRAIDGVEEPVYHQGEVVGHVTKYSDRLLAKMADAYLPEFQRAQLPDGTEGGLIVPERRVIVGISDVFALATELGIQLTQRIAAGAARGELPPVEGVLPDPAGGERPAGPLPPARP